MPHKIGNGAILGIVSEDGVPAQKRITLMDRSNLSIVKRLVSDEYGAYAITGLNPDTDDYLLFTVDDDGVEKKAAMIYDYVKPIPAHQGGFYWANWFRVSTAKEPLCSFIANTPATDPSFVELNFGVGRHKLGSVGGSLIPNKESITPAARSMATLGTVSTSSVRYALNHQNFMDQVGNARVSAEWVLDLSTVETTACILLVRTQQVFTASLGGSSYAHPSPFIALTFDKTTNKVALLRNNGADAPQDGKPLEASTLAVDYVVPAELRAGAIHIAASIDYGNSCQLYVNGLLVGSANLGGTNSTVRLNDFRQAYIFAILGSKNFWSATSYTNPATFDTSVFAFYSELMTADEALSHYESLFVDSLPVVTGYLKSVVSDFPLYLFRLDDENSSLVAIDALRPSNKAGNLSALTKFKALDLNYMGGSSIVVGGSGTYFNGGALRGVSQFSFPNSSKYASVEFIAQPSASTITDYQVIVSHRYTSSILFEVRLTATKKLNVAWLESAVPTVVSFNTVVSSLEMNHYAISVNKELGFAYLFVNGVLVESIVVSKIFFDSFIAPTKTTESLYIGGIAASQSSVSMAYIGYLSEVAAYPYALTERMVKAHYDARLIL